ncbi:MAG TPA: Amuc_1098 family type IV pilus outer membrane protein [Chthoniobacteraceae bacterium]|nr:Amuc_1098 family type IV pilus outer membrane protein [Chthoniobacteraceae bacterium]
MIKPPLVTFCSVLGLFTVATTPFALSQNASVRGVAEREIVRRQESVVRAREAIQAGNQALTEKEYDVAVQQYRLAVDLLPPSETTDKLRAQALALFSHASVKLAEQRITEGRYADAETTAKTVLEEQYNPGYLPAIRLLANLEKPDYYNKTITPGHVAKVEQVRQWLYDAEGFYDTGRYDLAEKRYHQVLNLDSYNSTARRGLERLNNAKIKYAEDAYNHTRSELVWKLAQAWELPVRRYGQDQGGVIEQLPQSSNNTVAINAKLNRIIIPRVEFRDATVREAIDFLKQKSRELDTSEPDPNRRGVNIVLQLDTAGAPAAPAPVVPADGGIPGLEPILPDGGGAGDLTGGFGGTNPNDARITLSLNNVPLMEVLRYITQLAGLKVKIDPYAVAIVPLSTITDQLLTKEYRVPPGFLSSNSGGTSAPIQASPTAPSGGGGSGLTGRASAIDYLRANGVQFPPGASANFIPSSSRLIVRNTQDNLDLIDTIVEAQIAQAPQQVEIESKFVEISQNNLKELSFDWMLGQFNIPGSDRVFGGGGTTGNGSPIDASDFPFTDPYGRIIGGNPITGGNRTGTGLGGAISANAIDALLFPTTGLTSAAPGVLGVAGVFTDPQFQVVMRALNQKKGVDLLSAPRVTTKSGNRASIEIIREFRYPTEFSPPQIPQTIESGTNSFITDPLTGILMPSGGGGSIPITPTTPTTFEMRKTGVILDVEPVVGSDGSTIDLTMVPEVTEFEGFINYGSPILQPSSPSIIGGILTQNAPQVVTPNVINQPIFSTRKVTTSVSVWDGQTVMLGGLMREDVQKVEDKVPLLGDIPFVGRLFRSSVDQHLKRNLVIFVSARLINPAGEPFNMVEEEEEVVEPLLAPPLPEAPLPLFTK